MIRSVHVKFVVFATAALLSMNVAAMAEDAPLPPEQLGTFQKFMNKLFTHQDELLMLLDSAG